MSLEAPGLTCASCHGPLYPDQARLTDDGWKHSYETRGKCMSNRVTRDHAQKRAERREDLQWMAETGESFSGAAKRLGVSRVALERWFRLNPMPEVKAALVSRDPIGEHSQRAQGSRAA